MRVFLDNCISPQYAAALRILDNRYEIAHLTNKFPPSTIDIEWLPQLAQEGDWVVVSADPRISKGAAERRAWREAGLTAFFFGKRWPGMRYWAQVSDLFTWWPKIIDEAKSATPGTGYLIQAKAKEFKAIYTPE